MQELVEAYNSGKSLTQIAAQTGRSVEGVRQKLLKAGVKMRPIGKYDHMPKKPKLADAQLPSCGKPPRLLYYQGNCGRCSIALYSWQDEMRELCGFCEKN